MIFCLFLPLPRVPRTLWHLWPPKSPKKAATMALAYSLTVFQEPRGLMRILQLVSSTSPWYPGYLTTTTTTAIHRSSPSARSRPPAISPSTWRSPAAARRPTSRSSISTIRSASITPPVWSTRIARASPCRRTSAPMRSSSSPPASCRCSTVCSSLPSTRIWTISIARSPSCRWPISCWPRYWRCSGWAARPPGRTVRRRWSAKRIWRSCCACARAFVAACWPAASRGWTSRW